MFQSFVQHGKGSLMSPQYKKNEEYNRRALLQYILICQQKARTSAHKGATGSLSQSIYELTVPTHPMM